MASTKQDDGRRSTVLADDELHEFLAAWQRDVGGFFRAFGSRDGTIACSREDDEDNDPVRVDLLERMGGVD